MSLWPEGLVGHAPGPPGPVQTTRPSLHPASAPASTPDPNRAPGSSPTTSLAAPRGNSLRLAFCPTLPFRAEKETKVKIEKITEIRDLTTQIMNIKR